MSGLVTLNVNPNSLGVMDSLKICKSQSKTELFDNMILYCLQNCDDFAEFQFKLAK